MKPIVVFVLSGLVSSASAQVTNSDFIQEGGFVATTNASLLLFNSSYHLTNGLLQAGQVILGEQSTASFVQDGGTANMTSLRLGLGLVGGGTYDLYSGWLYVSGTLTLEGLEGVAAFNQYGGTNFAGTLQLTPQAGSSSYNLYGGMFC